MPIIDIDVVTRPEGGTGPEGPHRLRRKTLVMTPWVRLVDAEEAGSIPGFVREADGSTSATTCYYRHLA